MTTRRTFLKRSVAAGAVVALGGKLGLPRMTRLNAEAQNAFSPAQLAGQRVIFSYSGTSVPESLLEQIRAGAAGGVIFFGENIVDRNQIAGVVAQLAAAQQASPMTAPLLLMTDQEGGLVRRLPGPPDESARDIGLSGDPAGAASAAGTAAGENLAGVGMNVNLAPVLDVFREAGGFDDQFGRSFSDDPDVVATCGAAFIAAQQAAGVAATAKHFPGLGAASADENTDLGPVTLPVSLDALRSIDEAPYPAAFQAGVKLVMLSWAVYPELDGSRPAGLSRAIVTDELRGRLGFAGVTITDALEAGAVTAVGSQEECAVLAAEAGMDIILCSGRDVGQGQRAAAALANALDAGRLDAGAFGAAIGRVNTLRESLAPGRFFPETGHTVRGSFLDYWNTYGGLAVFGFPITDEDVDSSTGFLTQYFERARLEWHPGEWAERFDIELGLLGVEIAERHGLLSTDPFRPVDGHDDANCTFFPATGHRLCFGFRSFWEEHGGLAIFGYPISEEYADSETGYTVQYFERQRFEYHPENPPEWQVLGGLLGSEVLES
ncbi:MAG: hypothetical protein M9890_09305 [Thermomicrobiales bacterium]|nr:hypothetical protein [Thermomicrobiales bacterium]